MRWLVPVFLLVCLVTSGVLAPPARAATWRSSRSRRPSTCSRSLGLDRHPAIATSLPAKVAVYFTTTNAAALVAWIKYFAGVRQEIWSPSKRA